MEFETKYFPLAMTEDCDGGGQKNIFTLHKDGRIEADWSAVARQKDLFLANPECRNDLQILCAAIWFAKNSP